MAPDQFSVARPLRAEDLDSRVTRHGIYPSLPAPNGVPWSEYVRTQRNRSRSISSSTEALESDHARYITRRIVQHARTMATGTRSLPTDSPVPYFQPIERDYMSEGSQEGVYAPPYVNPLEQTTNKSGTSYHSNAFDIDQVSTYTGLNDYDTMFAAGHGRGTLELVPRTSKERIMTTSVGITPPTMSTGMMANPMERVTPSHESEHISQKEQVSVPKDPSTHRVVSPSSETIGQGAAIFTDMTETILDTLDHQVAMAPDTQQAKGLSPIDNQIKEKQEKKSISSEQKERYPDLFLPVAENYRISDCFYGDSDSLSTDNNPMVLVMLKNLSYCYGTSVYVVDRVNGTMYGKFSVGCKIIPEKAMVIPQFQKVPLAGDYMPTYEETLPCITDIVTPIAKSTPVTQASQIPVSVHIPLHERDMVKPMSSERARTVYLE